MKKEFTAKTLDEAKAMAAAEFGVAAEEIDFDILEQPRKGLFGMKGVARVMASYEAPEASVASETAAVSEVSEAAEHSEPAEETHAEEPARPMQARLNLLSASGRFLPWVSGTRFVFP